MTGPLVVLGVLTVAGGWLNLPEFAHSLGRPQLLHHWLEPIVAAGDRISEGLGTLATLPHGSTETTLIGLAIAIAVVGLVLGTVVTLKAKTVPAHDAPAEHGLWKVLYHKYYVDELYDWAVVRPLVAFSRVVLWKSVDEGTIDGAGVNGAARLSSALGWLGTRLQSGQLTTYVTLFLFGVLYVLGMVSWR
jgi:NADH-quinone oxidoreductase subunit L